MASLSGEENIGSEEGIASDIVETREVTKTKVFDATFNTKTWREDMTLVVQGKHLYVSSSIISFVSPVFTELIEEAFGEDRPREIVLKEKKYEDIVEFLLCLYPNVQKPVDSDNVCVVLPLAVEYGTNLLREKCKEFLSSQVRQKTKIENMCLYLRTACNCEMADIKEKYIQMLLDSAYTDMLKAEKKFPLPLDAKVEIQHRKLLLLEKANERYEKILKKVDINKLWFHDSSEILKEFKNGCVGYLEYSVWLPGKGKVAESPAISVHGIDWNILVNISADGKSFSLYLKATQLLTEPGWSCRALAILTVRNNKTEYYSMYRTCDHVFTEMENIWGYEKIVSMDTQKHFFDNKMVHLEIKFIANTPSLKGD